MIIPHLIVLRAVVRQNTSTRTIPLFPSLPRLYWILHSCVCDLFSIRRSFYRLFVYYRQWTSMLLPTTSFLPPPPPTPSYIYNSDPHPQHSTLTLRRRMYHIIPHFNSLLIGYGWLHIHIHRICLDSLYFFSLFNLFEYGISVLL